MSHYEMKIDDDNMPRVRNGGRMFQIPVFCDGVVYPSYAALGGKFGVSAGAVCKAVHNRHRVRGQEVRRATVDEVREHLSVDDRPRETAPRGLVPALPFVGVVWPDGRVVVRLAMGGDWILARDRVEDLPTEVVDACRWLAS